MMPDLEIAGAQRVLDELNRWPAVRIRRSGPWQGRDLQMPPGKILWGLDIGVDGPVVEQAHFGMRQKYLQDIHDCPELPELAQQPPVLYQSEVYRDANGSLRAVYFSFWPKQAAKHP